jgi:hypothetical protein
MSVKFGTHLIALGRGGPTMETNVIAENRPNADWGDITRAPWTLYLAALATIIAVMGAIFFRDIKAAVEVWWNYPAYSHCYLIIPISAWLIWERRSSLTSAGPACSPLALFAAIPCLMLWFVGEFASITEFRQFAIVGLTEVFIVAILGMAHISKDFLRLSVFIFSRSNRAVSHPSTTRDNREICRQRLVPFRHTLLPGWSGV